MAISINDSKRTITYDRWERGLDLLTQRLLGVSLFDLPDTCTRDGYDAGQTIKTYYRETVLAEFRSEMGL